MARVHLGFQSCGPWLKPAECMRSRCCCQNLRTRFLLPLLEMWARPCVTSPSASSNSFARLLEFSFSSSLIEPYLLSSPLTFHYDQNRPYYKDIQCTLGKCCSEYHNNFSCVCFSQQLVAILFRNLPSQSPASSHGSLPICSFWQSSHLFPCQDKFNRDPLVWICTFFSRGSGSR